MACVFNQFPDNLQQLNVLREAAFFFFFFYIQTMLWRWMRGKMDGSSISRWCWWQRRNSDATNGQSTPTHKVHPPADQTVEVLGAVPRGNHVDDPVRWSTLRLTVTVSWSTRNIFSWCLRRMNCQWCVLMYISVYCNTPLLFPNKNQKVVLPFHLANHTNFHHT